MQQKVVKQEMNDGNTAELGGKFNAKVGTFPPSCKLFCNTIIHLLFTPFYCIDPYFIYKFTIFKYRDILSSLTALSVFWAKFIVNASIIGPNFLSIQA